MLRLSIIRSLNPPPSSTAHVSPQTSLGLLRDNLHFPGSGCSWSWEGCEREESRAVFPVAAVRDTGDMVPTESGKPP